MNYEEYEKQAIKGLGMIIVPFLIIWIVFLFPFWLLSKFLKK